MGTELSSWFLAHDVRHAEFAVAEPPQMLTLLVLPVGSSQSNLALALDILALISKASDFAGVLFTELIFSEKLFFRCISFSEVHVQNMFFS